MDAITANAPTIAVLLVVIAAMVLAVRALRKGSASCDSCEGECGSCGSACASPKIELTAAQEEKLRIIKAKVGE